MITALLIAGCSEQPKYDLVIHNADLFDGTHDMGIVNIAINADTIAAITEEHITGDSTLDASGKYMVPGLVNAHVHVSSIDHLREGYRLGIMYLLNMHTGLETREQDWKEISRDSIGYSVLYGAGHAATVPGGHPNQFSPDMETISSDSITIKQWVDNRIAQNVDYIKIVRDNHEWMGYPPLPTLSYEQIDEIIDYANSEGYRTVVHSNTAGEMARIAELNPSGFVHIPDYKEDYPVSDEYFEMLAAHDLFVIPTGGYSLKPMDDAPPFVAEWVTENLLTAEQRVEIIRQYHEHGILLVAGTDAQDGQMDFGEDYFLELELYRMAGLSNLETLRTATANAAKAFNLPVGELKVGSPAHFILLNKDPLDDITNLRDVNGIWKNGRTE